MARTRLPCSAADARGGRVVFLSHCLLNKNVRLPGGATCPGAIPELVAGYVADGVGIFQMPCPEQRAWGGVRKRHLLRLYGCAPLRSRRVRRLALAVATTWTTVRHRRLARRIACDIAGRGLLVACLDRALQARGVTVSYREHDLIAELHDAGAIAS